VSSDFKTWWADYASGWTPRWNHGHEQHAERIAAFVWEHRDYREAMLRGENASLRADLAQHTAELAALKAHDPLAEMWRELSEYQEQADRDGHGESWKRMCEERTEAAACNAAHAAREFSRESAWSASYAVREAAQMSATAAIAAIRRAKEAR
jgi:hypothetical protein